MSHVEESHTFYDQVNASQLLRLIIVGVGGLGVVIAGWLWPNFFHYNYLYVADNFFSTVASFWPAFAWAGGLSLLTALSGGFRTTFCCDEEFLQRGIITSIGAGVTEEAWYRGVGVFYTMVGLIVLNWFMSVFGWLVVALSGLAVVLMLYVLASVIVRGLLSISILVKAAVGIGASSLVVWGVLTYNHDPLYNIYEHLFYPIIDFTTFGLMHPVWEDGHRPFLVMGMFAANFAFRDGHKYQGFFGWSNSWFMGCVFIYATLMHGIWVAIVVHALYDIIIDVIKYLGRRFNGY